MRVPDIDLTVYPDECDAFGHLNQASFLSLFERARWEMLGKGPGMDVFTRNGAWPAVRKTTIDYHLAAYPGDTLRFNIALVHMGRSSFTLRQTARRGKDDALVATAEFLFVCIDRAGKPMRVPADVSSFFAADAAGDSRRRVVVNGVGLSVDVRGEGRAVLFIHGFPHDHTLWTAQLETLDGVRRIAPDLRGFGQSDAPDLGYSITTYADDLAALLDALGADDAVVVGVSMGGYAALELVRRHRARVRALVLVATRAEADGPEQRRTRDAQIAVARERGAQALALQLLPRMLRPDATVEAPEVAERVRAMMAAAPVSGMAGALAAMRDRPDATATLPTLAGTPVLVVGGRHDQIIPAATVEGLAAAVPGATLAWVEGAGHLPMVEQPAAMTALLQDFLATLP